MVGHFAKPEIVLHGADEVETVTNALAVYVDYLTQKYSDTQAHPMVGPWRGGTEDCLHLVTEDVAAEHDLAAPSASQVMCQRCRATRTTVDALDAVRGTVRGAVELRQRIVKEWGWDPTEG